MHPTTLDVWAVVGRAIRTQQGFAGAESDSENMERELRGSSVPH